MKDCSHDVKRIYRVRRKKQRKTYIASTQQAEDDKQTKKRGRKTAEFFTKISMFIDEINVVSSFIPLASNAV